MLHYGKYKGAIMVKEKELIRVAAPSHVALELRNNFQFAFGCSGGDHSLGLYIVRSGLGFYLVLYWEYKCFPTLVISPASATSSTRISSSPTASTHPDTICKLCIGQL
ncbi:hypothetical protein N7516_006987 [Penicillium verrucosum]|uniref:uncharacterized protein n=1 Tax=Penicillium verrucosum TaxID=60171 RepID=UPI002545A77B|nr:uncharacterized protein N7516_006987 [Penicillium verrucosum]KAJ5932498.1 hypothetical protein N7516_006987 [Penicillium verrucosum]